MAITNAMIVFTHQQELLEAGKIKPTGRMIEIETADGTQMIPDTLPSKSSAGQKRQSKCGTNTGTNGE